MGGASKLPNIQLFEVDGEGGFEGLRAWGVTIFSLDIAQFFGKALAIIQPLSYLGSFDKGCSGSGVCFEYPFFQDYLGRPQLQTSQVKIWDSQGHDPHLLWQYSDARQRLMISAGQAAMMKTCLLQLNPVVLVVLAIWELSFLQLE